jgi:hypothetical protein
LTDKVDYGGDFANLGPGLPTWPTLRLPPGIAAINAAGHRNTRALGEPPVAHFRAPGVPPPSVAKGFRAFREALSLPQYGITRP